MTFKKVQRQLRLLETSRCAKTCQENNLEEKKNMVIKDSQGDFFLPTDTSVGGRHFLLLANDIFLSLSTETSTFWVLLPKGN